MTIRNALRVSLYLMLALAVITAGMLGAFAFRFSPSREIVYRELDDGPLELQIFEPEDSEAGPRPGILFFFGGGWTGGSSIQFYPWADFFASQGWIGMTADYRVYSRHGTRAADALEDARAAFRFVIDNADLLGLDPTRIFLAGGSAGGHLAAATAITPWPDRAGLVDPAGLILLNPALDTRAVGEDHYLASVKDLLFGEHGEEISPLHHVRPGLPPTLVVHGTADGIVPFAHSRDFCERMNAAGNTCRLLPYEDAHHGFFNWGFGRFDEVIGEVAAFLAPLR